MYKLGYSDPDLDPEWLHLHEGILDSNPEFPILTEFRTWCCVNWATYACSYFVSLLISSGNALIVLQEMSSSCKLVMLQRERGNCSRQLSDRERETRWWNMAMSSIQPMVLGWPSMAESVCSKDSYRKR